MAVTEVMLSSLGGSGSAEGTDNGSENTSFRARFRVQCESPGDTAHAVLKHFRQTSSLPWFGRKYSYGNDTNPAVVCRTISANYVEGSGGWFDVDVGYEPLNASGTPGTQTGTTIDGKETTDPSLWRDEIEVGYTQISVPVWQATFLGASSGGGGALKKGKLTAVRNSAGMILDPPPEDTLNITVLRITQFKRTYFDFDDIVGYVNNDNVVINKSLYYFRKSIKPYHGLIYGVNQAYGYNDDFAYWRQTIEIHINPRGWHHFIPDMGTKELLKPGDRDSEGNILSASDFPARQPWDEREITDTNGYPSGTPQLLDGNGRRLDPSKDTVWLEYQIKGEGPFSALQGTAW